VQVHLTDTGERILTHLAQQHRDELESLSGVFRVTRITAFNDRD
jgi:hypothetical protein